jgi:hypothetical protein
MLENINKAMDAHMLWKVKLEKMIETGQSEVSLGVISADNECAFGKWLYSDEITEELKNTEIFKSIVDLHKKFHINAGKIAENAINGKKAEAQSLIGHDSDYNKTSVVLMDSLIKLRKQYVK